MSATRIDWRTAFEVGDAYGAGFEMQDEAYVAKFNDGVTYRQHGLASKAKPGDPVHFPGMTTDDTQMMLALEAAICKTGCVGLKPFDVAVEFCDAYAKRPAPGYGSRMRERLVKAIALSFPEEKLIAMSRADGLGRDSCGAAMRAIPCGVHASSAGLAVFAATLQARVTHHHPDSIDAAIVVAVTAHALLSTRAVDSGAALKEHRLYVDWPGDWTSAQWERGTTRGKDIVLATLWLLSRPHRSMARLLKEAVALGGDVDTLAALTLGLAALHVAYIDDLPPSLIEGLERP